MIVSRPEGLIVCLSSKELLGPEPVLMARDRLFDENPGKNIQFVQDPL